MLTPEDLKAIRELIREEFAEQSRRESARQRKRKSRDGHTSVTLSPGEMSHLGHTSGKNGDKIANENQLLLDGTLKLETPHETLGGTRGMNQNKVKRKPVLMNMAMLEELEKNPAYESIDVRKEAFKFNQWCDINGKPRTVKRFVGWLNRID